MMFLHISVLCVQSNVFVGAQRPRKNYGSHIDASHSRQPLVKGERLVRYEVNAVMVEDYTKSLLDVALLHTARSREHIDALDEFATLPRRVGQSLQNISWWG